MAASNPPVVSGAPATPGRRRRRIRGSTVAGAVGWILLGAVVAVAVLAPVLAPHDPLHQDLELRAGAPTITRSALGAHPLGNDQLGRDILSRLIYGSRVSLVVGSIAVLLGGSVGVTLGIAAGYFGGWADRIIMRAADIQLAFPFILLAMIIIAVAGPGITKLIGVLALSGWVTYARVVRSEVLSVREREFVQAARVVGLRDGRIMLRHILPNVTAPVIVVATLELARVVILEAALSFLGLGVQPPTPSWGRMLADGRDFLATAWWISTFPGLALMALVLGVNLVGDWLRDVLDPRIRYAS
ncbi:MAG: ABC transporter permease [Armatimonadota bacterium]|nr:ABC transporter permease [Armatimonadota bacterium]MDR7534309.1 ABC transporter permease [Armatimonadota bacterium]MDR7535921.1 ABC transporter permease [Armatimonadota bacterium]